ncbi:hypothetical protein ACLFMI_02230 [Pseudonocardia nantongensis]|uniref:hypothetical protein n=1 Tax=Pseudonocardia nantongensis TaxID=1181885 RepID=UPI00397C8510
MLKKAGIVVAAGAASLVAMSPLAFAGEGKSIDDSFNKTTEVQKGDNADNLASKDSKGLVNLANNNVNVSPQTCGSPLSGNSLVQGAIGGLFSEAENESGVKSDNSVNCTSAPDTGDEVEQSSDGKGKHNGGGDHK